MSRTNIYETTFIVNVSLDDAQIGVVTEKVKDFIVKNGGAIRELVQWGRKRFAYPIQNKNNGFYVVIEFSAPTDFIAKLERHYFLEENILRYLTIVLDKKALKARTSAAALLAEQAAAEAAPPAKTEAAVPVKVETPAAPATVAAAAPAPTVESKPVAAKEEDDEDDAT
ncbi:MAG: 30S ribosomal protein S6 [Ignavibacteria bacterium GWA2_55_25]|nr:30S ribosomal protein S6 [Ignavibacteriales bacterium]OGU18496.1 MAG: 30S ribosomal protein S6 [Ignavibacteria bacterium GWA2_55_25]